MPVIKDRIGSLRNLEDDTGDNIPAFPLLLEYRVPVGVTAVSGRDAYDSCVTSVNAFHGRDQLADFPSVGSDVLDSGCPYLSGNIRQVFRSPEVIVSAPGAEIVPDDTCAGIDPARVQLLDPFDCPMEHCPRDVLGKQQIASSAYRE